MDTLWTVLTALIVSKVSNLLKDLVQLFSTERWVSLIRSEGGFTTTDKQSVD